ncbi:MAG TPA: lactonase family protein [Tepidisphaeraceae bacterium]
MIVYVGTYTTPNKSKGIYTMRFDPASGSLTKPEVAAEVKSPSFLTIHPNHRFLYAIGEMDQFQGKKAGAVSAFSIDAASGKLALINQQDSGGPGPAYVGLDQSGKVALVANYGGGSVACLPIKADGSLAPASAFIQHHGSSVNPQRQKEPHAHSINPTPDNHFAIAADLGLDKLLIYKLDTAQGSLEPNDPPFATVPPGGGPRHFAFHPNGKWMYVVNEMGCSVTAFNYDGAKGSLTEFQTLSALPPGQNNSPKFSGAEIQVHPLGKFVYASMRGHNSLATFTVDEGSGKLTLTGNTPCGGKTPRNFRLDPSGRWLLCANQDSDNVVVFRVDQASGALTPAGVEAGVGSPVCVKFLGF